MTVLRKSWRLKPLRRQSARVPLDERHSDTLNCHCCSSVGQVNCGSHLLSLSLHFFVKRLEENIRGHRCFIHRWHHWVHPSCLISELYKSLIESILCVEQCQDVNQSRQLSIVSPSCDPKPFSGHLLSLKPLFSGLFLLRWLVMLTQVHY